jgi:predicted transcriptional regulator
MDTKEQLYFLSMLKAIGDENRLAMLRIVAQKEQTVTELAEAMGLPEMFISEHLTKLHGAGFLRLRMSDGGRFYRFNPQPIKTLQGYMEKLGEPLMTTQAPISDNRWIDALDISDEDKKILVGCTLDGRLTHFPIKDKKWYVVLRWIATKFEVGVRYSERQVNQIITEIHADYATIRRALVEFGFMSRERGGGVYWLTPKDEPHQ